MTFGDKFWSWYDRNFSKLMTINLGHWVRAAVTALGSLGFDEIHTPGGVYITQDMYDWVDAKIGDGSWGKFDIYWPTGWDFLVFTNTDYCNNEDGEYYFFRDLLGKDVLALWIVKKLAKWGINNPDTLTKVLGVVTGIATSAVRFVTSKAKARRLASKLDSIINSEQTSAIADTWIKSKIGDIKRMIGFKLI